ncbi:triphosphoribosyl-dephospho-CoA synthase CitG [Fructilactobacillus sanfranciscensis]|uniref:triphosphoribosyl-dephospho-CoA synthase CitG n=1 Tax=Fructilactobacillus sanfranciscensis TaxID=1625 RepID=UPI000CD3BC3D|nr:triphosphoribosyl-dephospho-CoA synthase CitG [Fructilactobacillus sanfranciscensis]MCG7196113.1 triphosphoribosyl-dephospho-CoA synthase CitG [Fructilactobacillus sanfranciscensis]NDR70003.1 triphosphoribosyl-dephospho-CoA synthase CitG [Fructilactobacillus sanfranciscensis]NDR98063.1 triphosphoribosyl-dephospho-CoA synthase CitG [Fructilactobacillus sanfranciscensis]NDS16564.1 triphosphoribosyl-dephospho-CoA synthase CitG [Fructilactobacillus sanfranciscensis]POH11162.1 triphosphoribosyl-
MIKNDKILATNAETATNLAVEAMLDEVVTWPKPGLVDPISNAGHTDMNVYTFINSSVTMMPYFKACWNLGNQFQESDLTELFRQLRPIGVTAEKTMFAATNGVNTHKGIVFILGIMVTALGYANQKKLNTVSDLINIEKQMTTGLVKNDLEKASTGLLTAGQKQFQQLGLTGIRGETEAGFPLVIEYGLPIYESAQLPQNERNLIALLAIIAHNSDSNLIKRAHNSDLVTQVQTDAQQIVTNYQETGRLDKDRLEKLCDKCATHNLSLGGSADLLILTIFLEKLIK